MLKKYLSGTCPILLRHSKFLNSKTKSWLQISTTNMMDLILEMPLNDQPPAQVGMDIFNEMER